MSAYDRITASIISAIESGQATSKGWKMPWHSAGGRPVNVASGRAYRGINTVVLWSEAAQRGYTSPLWGTLRQWNEKGARVRKGERSSLVVFWKDLPRGEKDQAEGEEQDRRFVLKTSLAFNAEQVEGWDAPSAPAEPHTPTLAEDLAAAAGVDLRIGGGEAFYHPRLDYVAMPRPQDFTNREAFQAVLLHEACHWTGHTSRLAREFGKKFGDRAYAFEELVAELGASFLCGDLGISAEPRLDHAQYVAHWLEVLKEDSRAIFTAASAASRAADFILASIEKTAEIAA